MLYWNHNTSVSIFIFLTFLLADDIIDIKRLITEPYIRVYEDQSEANGDLNKYVEDTKPQNIYMVEYSSWSVQSLINTLIKNRTHPNIYLLLQHPIDGEVIYGQKERICKQITTVIYQQEEFKNYPNLKILFYKQRTSFRGRNFDNKLINVGWYIYKYDENGQMRVYGHNQPVITFRESYEGFSNIKKMFNDTFENLWVSGIRLKEAFNECYDSPDPHFIEWCEKVSPKKEERHIEIKE